MDIFNDSSSYPLASSSVVRAVVASSLSSPQLENVSSTTAFVPGARSTFTSSPSPRARVSSGRERDQKRASSSSSSSSSSESFPLFSKSSSSSRIFRGGFFLPRFFIFVASLFLFFFSPSSSQMANGKQKGEKKTWSSLTQKKTFSKALSFFVSALKTAPHRARMLRRRALTFAERALTNSSSRRPRTGTATQKRGMGTCCKSIVRGVVQPLFVFFLGHHQRANCLY